MDAYQGNSDYIALCFSPKNRETAEKIYDQLAEARLRVWSSRRGCSPAKESDAARLAACCTALILVSAEWNADEKCTAQLRKAAEAERQIVLLFLDDTDLAQNEKLNLLLSRSTRMLDYDSGQPAGFMEELLSLMCIQDCKMAENEEPDTKKVGFLGLFG